MFGVNLNTRCLHTCILRLRAFSYILSIMLKFAIVLYSITHYIAINEVSHELYKPVILPV